MKIFTSSFLYKMLFVVILYLMNYVSLPAQQPSATFTSPTDGAVNVSVNQSIEISTSHPYDTSTFQYLYDENPTLMIIPKYVYDNEPDSIWKFFAFWGEYEFVDSTTLTFTPYTFNYATESVALLNDLNLIVQSINPGIYDTIAVSESITFKTLLLPHHMVGSSLDYTGGLYHCGDTLKFYFNRPIDSISTYRGDIIALKKVDSTGYIDSQYVEYISEVPSTVWLTNDSTEIWVYPNTNIENYKRNFIDIKVGLMSGDSLDFFQIPIRMRSILRLEFKTETIDSTDTLPSDFMFYNGKIGARDLYLNDSLYVETPDYFDDFKFVRWVCPQDDEINNSNSNTMTLWRDCYNATDLDITAVYDKVTSSTFTIIDTTDGFDVFVYNSEGDSLGGAGNYIVSENEYIFLSIGELNSSSFTNWDCTNEEYDNKTDKIIILKGSVGSLEIIPSGITPESPDECLDFHLCVFGAWDSSSPINNENIEDVFYMSCDGWDYENDSGIKCYIKNGPGPKTFNVFSFIKPNESCDCYRIKAVYFNGVRLQSPNNEVWSGYITLDSPVCNGYLAFVIERKIVTLDLSLEVDDECTLTDSVKNYIESTGKIARKIRLYGGDLINGKKVLYRCGENVTVNMIYNNKRYTSTLFEGEGYETPVLGTKDQGNETKKYFDLNPICSDYKVKLILDDHDCGETQPPDWFLLESISLNTNPHDPYDLIEYGILDANEHLLSDLESDRDQWQIMNYSGVDNVGDHLHDFYSRASIIDFNFNKELNSNSVIRNAYAANYSLYLSDDKNQGRMNAVGSYLLNNKKWQWVKAPHIFPYGTSEPYEFFNSNKTLRITNEAYIDPSCNSPANDCFGGYLPTCPSIVTNFYVNNNVLSIDNLPLSNPTNWNIITIIPQFDYTLDYIKFDYTNRNIYKIAGIILAVSNINGDKENFKFYPNKIPPSSDYLSFPINTDIGKLFSFKPISRNDQLDIGVLFYEIDKFDGEIVIGGSIYQNIQNILDKAIEKYKAEKEKYQYNIGTLLEEISISYMNADEFEDYILGDYNINQSFDNLNIPKPKIDNYWWWTYYARHPNYDGDRAILLQTKNKNVEFGVKIIYNSPMPKLIYVE